MFAPPGVVGNTPSHGLLLPCRLVGSNYLWLGTSGDRTWTSRELAIGRVFD